MVTQRDALGRQELELQSKFGLKMAQLYRLPIQPKNGTTNYYDRVDKKIYSWDFMAGTGWCVLEPNTKKYKSLAFFNKLDF